MAARTVDGPEDSWLSAAQIRKELGGISNGTLRKLIQSGEFPAPLEVVPGGMKMWVWDDVVYWRLRVDRRERLKNSECQTAPFSEQPETFRQRKKESG